MDWVQKTDGISILYLLLPGFLAASVFYSLTAHPKKEAFERVVQALIFTVIVKALNVGLRKFWWVKWHITHQGGYWTDSKELVGSVCLAIAVGVAIAVIVNWDMIHYVLRLIRVTKRTSYPSEWYSGFHHYERDVILHLKDDRRLRAWVLEYPDQCDKGHFLLADLKWLGVSGEEYPQAEVEATTIAATDVEMVQFMLKSQDDLTVTLEELDADRARLAAVTLSRTEPTSGETAVESEPTSGEVEDRRDVTESTEEGGGEVG